MAENTQRVHGQPLPERVARLEGETELLRRDLDRREAEISELRKDLVEGLGRQESLLREMVDELRGQHSELKGAHERMNSFTRGVTWVGGTMATIATIAGAWAAAAGSLFGAFK